jgi:hypothetical protein
VEWSLIVGTVDVFGAVDGGIRKISFGTGECRTPRRFLNEVEATIGIAAVATNSPDLPLDLEMTSCLQLDARIGREAEIYHVVEELVTHVITRHVKAP